MAAAAAAALAAVGHSKPERPPLSSKVVPSLPLPAIGGVVSVCECSPLEASSSMQPISSKGDDFFLRDVSLRYTMQQVRPIASNPTGIKIYSSRGEGGGGG